MGRRKKPQMGDGAGSSDDDAASDEDYGEYGASKQDLEDEANMSKGKRRRFTKEEALYGIWAEDSDDDNRKRSSKRGGRKLQDGISFVKGDPTSRRKPDEDEDSDAVDSSDEDAMDVDDKLGDNAEDNKGDSMSDDEDDSDEEPPQRAPRIRDEEEDEDDVGKPRIGGLGLGSTPNNLSAQQPSFSSQPPAPSPQIPLTSIKSQNAHPFHINPPNKARYRPNIKYH
ncbi:hypothetical protein BC829DRAFT_445661 [Chytridium lagenaria]|nr:hypothetical protein BC829DRAFT_445661 [Chytridium lagenaria]